MGQIVGYRITYMSTSSVAWKADIRCYGSTKVTDPMTALIRFYPDSAAIPADGWVNNKVNGVPIVNYPLSRFNDIITILRDEDNVSVNTFSYLSGLDFVSGWGVSTGMEDVGDMDP